MTLGSISQRVAADRLGWLDQLVQQIRSLPPDDRNGFFADTRNVLAVESCPRRSLEALLDLGRHILAKGFGEGVTEYKEIAAGLKKLEVLSAADAELLRVLAGYRDRLVHFYHEVTEAEIYELCSRDLGDLERVAAGYRSWLRAHPERSSGPV